MVGEIFTLCQAHFFIFQTISCYFFQHKNGVHEILHMKCAILPNPNYVIVT